MAHIDIEAPRRGFSLVSPQRTTRPVESGAERAVAHIVDVGADTELLVSWLTAAGVEAKICAHAGALREGQRANRPGCLVVDERSIPAHCALGYPIVVTADRADVAMAVRAMKSGAVDFVEKPLREQEIVTAVLCAIERDRQQRVVAARHAEWCARFATLSPRERQVMKLVTAGKLNKQVGGDLGLSEITVKAHRGAVMRKMNARSLAELVRMADAIGDALAPALEMRA